jgi:phosphate transport system substrate-binding protein
MKMIPSLPSLRLIGERSLQLAALGFACCLFTGCPSSEHTTPPPAGAKPKLVIRGSNTLGEELAPRLITEYKKTHADLEFDTEFKGTVYGVGALMAERCDLAAASRELTTNELALAKDREIEFNDYIVGSYSVAVVVNAGNPVVGLSRAQVRDIFSGTVTNWKDVGGPDAPIHLCIRDQLSGTHLGFQELAMEKKPYPIGVKTFTSYEAIVQAVAKEPHSVGFSSIELAASPGIKGVNIDGAAPTLDAVKSGKYPYARMLRFYTDKKKESAAAKEFAQFVQSAAGQKILVDVGFVPKP